MQPPVLDPPARRIPLEGPVNFRDLGGYAGHEGRTVRWRQVFRADALDSMTAADVRTVMDDLGLRAVVDLRNDQEIRLSGVGPIEAAPVAWHNVSILDETSPLWQRATAQGDMVQQYLAMLDSASGAFVQAVTLVAERPGPLVFHCAAGKDRTGLIAAFVLSVIGVSEDVIAHDYALTNEVIPTLHARYLARGDDPTYRELYEARPGWRERSQKSMAANHDTIVAVMAELTRRSGSLEGWLRDNGLDAEVPAALRAGLLD